MLTLALPKGRIFDAAEPLLAKAGIVPVIKKGQQRSIGFDSTDPHIRIIKVRAADVLTYVSYGTAQVGLAGRDVLLENQTNGVVHGVNLGIGKCRLVVACPKDFDYKKYIEQGKRITVATKYPRLTQNYFAKLGVKTEIVRLYGSMELAPSAGLSDVVVDLVATGKTLRANNLVEVDSIMNISTSLIFNQATYWRRQQVLFDLAKRLAKKTK